jgi:hypothetical protein
MQDETYDDGLVHNHRWATEPTMPRPERREPEMVPAPVADYDDGLVHGHAWAVQAPER